MNGFYFEVEAENVIDEGVVTLWSFEQEYQKLSKKEFESQVYGAWMDGAR